MDWIKITVVLCVTIFVLVLLIKRFVYFRPVRFVGKSQYTDVYEGNLHAWLCGNNAPITLLYCHGNTGNISHRIPKIEQMVAAGLNVLIFDYSGYGKSSGVPTEKMCYTNAETFMAYLLRNNVRNIVPYGEGMGAAVALHIGIRYGLSRVILDSPWRSVTHAFPILKPFRILFNEFDSETLSKSYRGAILYMGETFRNFSEINGELVHRKSQGT